MNKLMLAVAVMLCAVSSQATPYMRPIDFGHIQQSAAVLIDPNGVAPTVGVTDIAILTHSTADGSIIPKAWQGVIPPENWAPLEVGFGGSAHITGGKVAGNAVLHVGTSVNLAPQIGALILSKVNAGSPGVLQAVKAAMLNVGGGGVRIGGGFSGTVINSGIFQSMKEAFPGRGPLDIAKKAGRVEVGYAWTY